MPSRSSALSRTPAASRLSTLASANRRELKYAGKVGTGFTRKASVELRKKLDAIATPKSKLTANIDKPKATWVNPSLLADVEFRDVTSEGYLRHSSLKGLKDRN